MKYGGWLGVVEALLLLLKFTNLQISEQSTHIITVLILRIGFFVFTKTRSSSSYLRGQFASRIASSVLTVP